MSEKKKKVAPDIIAFCEEYLITHNATKAYAATHPKAKRASCWTGGSRMLRNVEVLEYLEARVGENMMKANEVMATYSDQARGNLAHFLHEGSDGKLTIDLDDDESQAFLYLLKSVQATEKVIRTQRGKRGAEEEILMRQMRIELLDPQNALEHIGRYWKLFIDKHETDLRLHIEGVEEIMSMVYGSHRYTDDPNKDPLNQP